jgi:predicted RNA-binding Zn-ribbon protein involved in translation (DUF1610 family)
MLDQDVIHAWGERCRLYRRRTWWLWLVVSIATVTPILLVLGLGARAFIAAFCTFAVCMAVIGIVLARTTHLLFCPHCGQRPVSLSGRYKSPLYADSCAHCGFWLRQPATRYG